MRKVLNHSRRKTAALLGFAFIVGSVGCTLEPPYQRPTAPVAPRWPDLPDSDIKTQAQTAGPAADIGWRDFFTDQRLQKLIEIALEHNPDAQIAALNVEAARAQYQIQRDDLFPSVGGLTAVEQADRYPPGVVNPGTGVGPVSTGGGITRYYNVGIGFTSYEIDLFGRIRSLDHAKLEQYFGYVETRRSAQISLVAEIGSIYLGLLADQELLRLTEDTLKNQQASYELTKMSFEGGVASELDLRQAQSTVEAARANLAQYKRQSAQHLNQLVLLGAPVPNDLPPATSFDDEKFVTDLAPGVPSEVLTRRPDILAAEHNLVAANANIGAARANFFPSVKLTADYGTASSQLSGLFDHGSSTWTFSPQINLPIFAFDAGFATLRLDHVQKNVYIVQYEQAIETAFREVADALVARSTLEDEITADQALVEATSAGYRLSEMRFRNGVNSYLSVLDSQRSMYTAQVTLINAKLARLQNLVTLYKVLGGGWSEHDIAAAPTENSR